MYIKDRKNWIKKIMEIAQIEGFQQADEIAQAVVKLFQASISQILAKEISESVPADLSEGWNLIHKRNIWGEIDTIEKRKDFVKKLMEITEINDYKRADEIAQVVLKLLQVTLDEDLSKKVAASVPPDLKKGWEMIEQRQWRALDFMKQEAVRTIIR
ncbi:hypothetical protein QUF75_14245 [Desulfococcaceae bacterium HSG7]|nr:hypothetical protein [Desulfococcaceae bacterium HSG7]